MLALAGAGGDNKCWEIGNGKKACACAGKQWFEMGAGRTCSHCEAACRGNDPNAIPNAPVAPVGDNRCYPAINASGRLNCQCAGQAAFQMGPGRTCPDCEAECRKRGIQGSYARAYASYPMKGLIVS